MEYGTDNLKLAFEDIRSRAPADRLRVGLWYLYAGLMPWYIVLAVVLGSKEPGRFVDWVSDMPAWSAVLLAVSMTSAAMSQVALSWKCLAPPKRLVSVALITLSLPCLLVLGSVIDGKTDADLVFWMFQFQLASFWLASLVVVISLLSKRKPRHPDQDHPDPWIRNEWARRNPRPLAPLLLVPLIISSLAAIMPLWWYVGRYVHASRYWTLAAACAAVLLPVPDLIRAIKPREQVELPAARFFWLPLAISIPVLAYLGYAFAWKFAMAEYR